MQVSARTKPLIPTSHRVDSSNERRLSLVAKPEARDQNHLFINNIRFWSILSIVAVHSANSSPLLDLASWQVRAAFTVPAKFGTIGFFLVSGFLLGERLVRSTPFDYFTRRTNKVALSWFFWFCIAVMISVLNLSVRHHLAATSADDLLRLIGANAWGYLWNSTFWFVPNFLISIAVLLAFRRYLYTLRLGAALLAINLVYVVNIYALWFPPKHTQAVFGFVFYLWLGSYIAHSYSSSKRLLDKISFRTSIALALITAILAYLETSLLTQLHKPGDTLNTLRLSNQLFSVAMTLMLFKLKRATWPRFIDVRRHIFGLYLTHTIVLTFLVSVLKVVRNHFGTISPLPGMDYVVYVFGLITIAFFVSLAVTAWLARRPSLQWMVGLSAQKPAPAAVTRSFWLPETQTPIEP